MKVAIVGGALTTRSYAPYDDKEWKIWVLGNQIDDHKRIDKVFEIHKDLSHMHKDYIDYIFNKNIPLIVSDTFPLRGDHVSTFPYKEAQDLLDGHLTSTIAYMMALAILEGATHINLYGVNMDVDDSEYFYQRPGLYAWRGYAKGIGIEVEAPYSTLFKEGLYPDFKINVITEPYTQNQFNRMAELHREKINEIQETINTLQHKISAHHGCAQVYERLSKIARATDAGIGVRSLEDSTKLKG